MSYSSTSSLTRSIGSEDRDRAAEAKRVAEALWQGATDSSETSSVRGTRHPGAPAARLVNISDITTHYPTTRPVYVSDDIVAGSQQNGRMSPVRRFFCLLVTFDVLFSALLWVMTVIVTGRDIETALHQQVIEYTIHSSLFDIVVVALLRFLSLIALYAAMNLRHWWPVALTTTGTSVFLIAKVFEYEWTKFGYITFDVMLILVSFILAWGEVWFLDFRVLPLEMKASEIAHSLIDYQDCERAPLLRTDGSMLHRYMGADHSQYASSVANYYSPMESPDMSDDEEEADVMQHGVRIPRLYRHKRALSTQELELRRTGNEALFAALELIQSEGWRRELLSNQDDLVESRRLGAKKLFRITGLLNVRPAALLEELFYRAEASPSWNPALKECRTLQLIDAQTDITYQVCPEVSGGVSTRDFVDLRHWQLTNDGAFVLAVRSVAHPSMPAQPPRTRGENGISCFVICVAAGDSCRLQWMLNTDLKGWIPQAVIDSMLHRVMSDFMKHLRRHLTPSRQPSLPAITA